MTEVHKKINTGSIGLGVLGSPAWVLGAALAFKLLESEADQVAAEKTHQQLRTLEKMAQDIRDGGRFIPVGNIDMIDYPIPGLWVADSPDSEETDTTGKRHAPTWYVYNRRALHPSEVIGRIGVFSCMDSGSAIFSANSRIDAAVRPDKADMSRSLRGRPEVSPNLQIN